MGAAVIGVDLAANLIQAARAQYPDIEFRVGDMAELDFEDCSFDVVLISFNSLDCLYPKEMRLASLRQVWRVLRPDGTLVLSHHNLAALFCGWYRFMRPGKLAYRLKHILDGSAWKSECYLPDYGVPEVKLYYAYPRQVVSDLHLCGFEASQAIPNDPVLWGLQRVLHTDFFTRLSDPWPYYVCRKTGEGGLSSARATAERAH
jgi:SAM-dependent methyltransferase